MFKKTLSLMIIIILSSCYDKEGEKQSKQELKNCYDKEGEKQSKQELKNCFDIIKAGDKMPNQFLINRCTGETWTIQNEDYQNIRTYRWLKINKTDEENSFKAI